MGNGAGMVNRYTVVSKTNSVAQRKEIVNIMANHSIDTKAVDSFPRNGLVVRILIALGILALVIVTAQTVANRNEPSPVAPESKTFEQTFSTQQYWDKAAEYEARKAAEQKAAREAALLEEPEWSYYTEQYWAKTR